VQQGVAHASLTINQLETEYFFLTKWRMSMATGSLIFAEQELYDAFPTNAEIRQPRSIQRDAIVAIANGARLLELPTGTGKTALQYMVAAASLNKLEDGETVFWIFPTKALVQQAKQMHPSIVTIYGKQEHPCIWAAEDFEEDPTQPVTRIQLPVIYDDKGVSRVSEIPQVLCVDCPHFVNQETGQTNVPGKLGCTYYQQTREAKRGGGIIACTMSFYIFAKLFARRKADDSVHQTAYGRVSVLVIDEVHRFSDVIRYTLSYDISDWHVQKAIDLLKRIDAPEYKDLRKFLKALNDIATAHAKEPQKEHLLTSEEITKLIAILAEIDPKVLDPKRINEAVRAGLIDRKKDFCEIKLIEVLARDIRRYIHTLEYALPGEERTDVAGGETISKRGGPLNYSCSYFKEELGENDKVQNKLVLHCHYVAPLVRRRLKAPTTLSFSATIGKPEIFAWDSGVINPSVIKEEFHSAPSTFPTKNRRIYLPQDVEDLSMRSDPTGRKRTKTLRQIAKGCRELAQKHIRSLVLVPSNDERQKFMRMAVEEGVEALTYSEDLLAKDAARKFAKDGEGEVLVGCVAHYGVGLDLPDGTASVIWFLRPGYADPESAATQFEIQRFGEGGYWKRQYYKVMLEAQQAMGRNIRGPKDRGVCFLMSTAFQKFVYHGLPEWLQGAYVRDKMLDECLEDTMKLLS